MQRRRRRRRRRRWSHCFAYVLQVKLHESLLGGGVATLRSPSRGAGAARDLRMAVPFCSSGDSGGLPECVQRQSESMLRIGRTIPFATGAGQRCGRPAIGLVVDMPEPGRCRYLPWRLLGVNAHLSHTSGTKDAAGNVTAMWYTCTLLRAEVGFVSAHLGHSIAEVFTGTYRGLVHA